MEGSPGGFSEPPAEPTPQQNELFHLTVKNFVDTAKSHRRVLANSWLSLALADIDNWSKGENLPELSKRAGVMGFIWNHNCNCKCS